MYGKVFTQIYDGTLVENWQALVTFQQLIVLADRSGVVDMTPTAIHRRTGIPLEIIETGLRILEAPDKGSRTPEMEGRRIVRIDGHRDWGWQLVNHKKYRDLVSQVEKQEADRVRIATHRAAEKANKSAHVASCSGPSQGVADVAHADAEAYAEAKEPSSSATPKDPPPGLQLKPKEPKGSLAERLRIVTREAVETFNASTLVKSQGGALANVSPSVGREKRQAQIRRCIRTAREICAESYGGTITREFWVDYWTEIAKDDFLAGRRGGGPGHENWRPDFEYLTREATMLKVYDRAAGEAAA
jgi:hypothetical protein